MSNWFGTLLRVIRCYKAVYVFVLLSLKESCFIFQYTIFLIFLTDALFDKGVTIDLRGDNIYCTPVIIGVHLILVILHFIYELPNVMTVGDNDRLIYIKRQQSSQFWNKLNSLGQV